MTDEESDEPAAYPTGAELPDETPEPAEAVSFAADPDEFADVSAFAEAEWEATTTARERVESVIERTTEPTTVREVADAARVAETTARDHLDRLVEDGRVVAGSSSAGTTYRRDPDRHLMERVRRLAATDGLEERLEAAQAEVETYRDRYDAETPGELLVGADGLSDEQRRALSEWRTAERDLSYLRAAYRFREAREATAAFDATEDRQVS